MKVVHLNFAHGYFYGSQLENSETAMKFPVITQSLRADQHDLDRDFQEKHAGLLRQRRGAGYWIWKAQLIKQVLRDMPDGDVVFYTDAGMNFIADPTPLVRLTDTQPVVGFYMDDQMEGMWTKRDVFKALNADGMRFNKQMIGAFFLARAGAEAKFFVDEWLKLVTQPHLVDDSPSVEPNFPEFRDHRHDQSILSLLYRRLGYTPFPDPSQWGNDNPHREYPQIFFHHRRRV